MILPAEGRDENGAGFGRTGQYGVTRTRLREVLEEAEGWDIVHISGGERHPPSEKITLRAWDVRLFRSDQAHAP